METHNGKMEMAVLPEMNGKHNTVPKKEGGVTITANGGGDPELGGETEAFLANGTSHETPGSNQVSENINMPFVMMFLRHRLHILPIFTAIFIIASFFISYAIAVANNHVEPDFPYISYTAIKAPERCVFAQLVNFGAFLLASNIYIRYLQMKQVLIQVVGGRRKDFILNKAALAVGVLSAVGLSMVANFQTVEMRPGHYTGAGLAFILGMVYCWMQTAFSIRFCRWNCVAISQLVNSIVLSTSLIVFATSKSIYKYNDAIGNGTKFDSLRGVYLVSTISEWLTAASIVTFALTYCRDFKRINLHLPRVEIRDTTVVRQDYHLGTISNGTTVVTPPQQNGTVHVV